MKLEDCKDGMEVLYVPHHAHGDKSHSDCEHGIVSSKNDTFVFVRYYHKNGGLKLHAQATDPNDLVR